MSPFVRPGCASRRASGLKLKVDLYVAGLHRQGSKAVRRYTMLELKDRFALMCAAFGEEQYKVGEDFEMNRGKLPNVYLVNKKAHRTQPHFKVLPHC